MKIEMDALPWWFWRDDIVEILADMWIDKTNSICIDQHFDEWWGFMAEQLWAIREGVA
jgi:hypothetical protein